MDGARGILDGQFGAVRPHQHGVLSPAGAAAQVSRRLDGIQEGFARTSVDEAKRLLEVHAHRLHAGPPRHAPRRAVEVRHLAGEIQADHGLAESIQDDRSEIRFHEKFIADRFHANGIGHGRHQRRRGQPIHRQVFVGAVFEHVIAEVRARVVAQHDDGQQRHGGMQPLQRPQSGMQMGTMHLHQYRRERTVAQAFKRGGHPRHPLEPAVPPAIARTGVLQGPRERHRQTQEEERELTASDGSFVQHRRSLGLTRICARVGGNRDRRFSCGRSFSGL